MQQKLSVLSTSSAGTPFLYIFFEQERRPRIYLSFGGTLTLQRSRSFGVSDSPETMRLDELWTWFSEYPEFPERVKLPLLLDIPVLKAFSFRGTP